MISIVGKKDAGKTTLIVALAAELVRRKFRVMTIKHGTHAAESDQRGKDTWRHRHEGHAERVGPGPDPAPLMLSPADAARLILDHLHPLPAERRPLREALDLVLAEDVASPMDLPPWDNSAMDGYAVRGADVAGRSRIDLAVVETVPAGHFPTKPVGPGEATPILPGAPLPQGAATVVRLDGT